MEGCRGSFNFELRVSLAEMAGRQAGEVRFSEATSGELSDLQCYPFRRSD